jgi:hypothetical protein
MKIHCRDEQANDPSTFSASNDPSNDKDQSQNKDCTMAQLSN